jgi:hypothetical protein
MSYDLLNHRTGLHHPFEPAAVARQMSHVVTYESKDYTLYSTTRCDMNRTDVVRPLSLCVFGPLLNHNPIVTEQFKLSALTGLTEAARFSDRLEEKGLVMFVLHIRNNDYITYKTQRSRRLEIHAQKQNVCVCLTTTLKHRTLYVCRNN